MRKKDKIEQSMQTLPDMRISPFLPIAKINKNSKLYKEFVKNNNVLRRETSWGTIEIRNRLLTQYHADVLNAIMSLKQKKVYMLKDGRMAVVFGVKQLTKPMELEWGTRNRDNILEALKEIKDVVIVRETKGTIEGYNIIDEFNYSKKLNKYIAVFSRRYIEHFMREITLYFPEVYTEMRKHIHGRGEGLIKAIVNFFLTHKEGQQIGLEKLLETIGWPTSTERQIRNAKEILTTHSETLIKYFNIAYDKKTKTLRYTDPLDVKFLPPASKAETI